MRSSRMAFFRFLLIVAVLQPIQGYLCGGKGCPAHEKTCRLYGMYDYKTAAFTATRSDCSTENAAEHKCTFTSEKVSGQLRKEMYCFCSDKNDCDADIESFLPLIEKKYKEEYPELYTTPSTPIETSTTAEEPTPFYASPAFIACAVCVPLLIILVVAFFVWKRKQAAKEFVHPSYAHESKVEDGVTSQATSRSTATTLESRTEKKEEKKEDNEHSAEGLSYTGKEKTASRKYRSMKEAGTPKTCATDRSKHRSDEWARTPVARGTRTPSPPQEDRMDPAVQKAALAFFRLMEKKWKAPLLFRAFGEEIAPISCPVRHRHEIPDGFMVSNKFYCNTKTRLHLRFQPEFCMNANVAGIKKNLVLTQVPLRQSFMDFYQAVLDQRARVVIMLVNRREIVSDLYYPLTKNPKTGKYQMKCEERERVLTVEAEFKPNIGSIECSRLTAELKKELDGPFTFTHYYVPNWKDLMEMKGFAKDREMLEDITTMLDHALIEAGSRPIFIHCYDGTGPTGAIAVALEIAQLVIGRSKKVDPVDVGMAIRRARDGAIQNGYEFLIGLLLAANIIIRRLPPERVSTAEAFIDRFQDEIKCLLDAEKKGKVSSSRTGTPARNSRKASSVVKTDSTAADEP